MFFIKIDSIVINIVDSFKSEHKAGDQYERCPDNSTDIMSMCYNKKYEIEQLPERFRRGGTITIQVKRRLIELMTLDAAQCART